MRVKPQDHLERREPFDVETDDGESFRFTDPRALPWRTLKGFDYLDQDERFQVIVGDRYDDLMSKPEVDGYWIEYVMERYAEHFGLGTQGEGSASPS